MTDLGQRGYGTSLLLPPTPKQWNRCFENRRRPIASFQRPATGVRIGIDFATCPDSPGRRRRCGSPGPPPTRHCTESSTNMWSNQVHTTEWEWLVK